VAKFCKQLAFVSVVAKTGLLDFENTIQIGEPHAPDSNCSEHSVILYFGALGGTPKPVGSKKQKKNTTPLDKNFGPAHTETKMQLSVNCPEPQPLPMSLMELRRGDAAILDGIDLPTDDARRLMELGFVPGIQITAGRSAPGGDPQVFQVDGSEIALRRETARHLRVRAHKTGKLKQTPRA
jgi:ferrous iron transport protein A